MQFFSPKNESSFDGFISQHQSDIDNFVIYSNNDFYYSKTDYNASNIFKIGSYHPSAYSSTSESVVLLFTFINKSILLSHYQMQQRNDMNPPDGYFSRWILEARHDTNPWTQIDQRNVNTYIRGSIGLYEVKGIIANQLRLTIFQRHCTINQIEFYGSITNAQIVNYEIKCITEFHNPYLITNSLLFVIICLDI